MIGIFGEISSGLSPFSGQLMEPTSNHATLGENGLPARFTYLFCFFQPTFHNICIIALLFCLVEICTCSHFIILPETNASS